MPKHRKQILLEDTQYERLVELARSIDRTVTDLVGELVERGLEADATRRRKLQALDHLAELGERIEKRGGVSAADLVAQVRDERERQRDDVLFGGPVD